MPAPPTLTRRRALGVVAGSALLLAGCTTEDVQTAATPTVGEAAGGEATSAGAAALDEAELVARYEAVLAAFQDRDEAVTSVLTDIRDQHAEHRDALGGAPDAPTPTRVDPSLDAAIGDLLARERAAAKARRRACVAADDPAAARLLALIGASEASHVPALRELRA